MAFYDLVWYYNFGDGSTTGYFAVPKRPQNTAVVAGQMVRQFTAPAYANERVYICIVAGTTANTTDATWTLTRAAKVTDGTATWMEITGVSAVNGDAVNTRNWTAAKAIGVPTLGAIIQRNNGASYQICTTAGTLGTAEPAFSDTAGVTTTETSATTVWTSLGPVGNFTGGQAPHATHASVFSQGWVAGNTDYIGDNSADGRVSGFFNILVASNAVISKLISHNHAGPYPPTASDFMFGAVLSNTATGGAYGVNGTGWWYVYGVTFRSGGSQTNGVANCWYYFDNCSFQGSATMGAIVFLGGDIILNNTTFKLFGTADYIWPQASKFVWQNTGQVLVSGSALPTPSLIRPNNATGMSVVTLEALDLSQITTAVVSPNGFAWVADITIKDCKLNASATFPVGFSSDYNAQFVRCDSGATAYKSTRTAYEGTETTETSITRSGGAADPTGQAQSRKIVTTANAQWLRPFKAEPYAVWNPTTGSTVTVTVYGTVNAGALPFNDEIWLDVEYLGSSSSPLGTIVNTTKATLLSSNAAVSSDGSTWNGGGSGAGWSPFKLVATLSSPQPGMAGYVHARVRAGKASTTYYIDPKVVLT